MKKFTIVFYVVALVFLMQSAFAQAPQKKNLNKKEQIVSIAHIIDNSNSTFRNELNSCPPNAFWGQGPSGSAFTSSSGSEYTIYQRFSNISDTIYGLHFWSMQLIHTGSWQQCFSDPMNFTIGFYTDRQDKPHLLEYSEDVELVPILTGELWSGSYPIYEYTVFFETPIVKSKGWFSIQSTNEDCWSLLFGSNSASSMGIAYQVKDEDYSLLETPLAFCFMGKPSPCAYPISLSAVTDDVAATLKWLENGSAESWNVEYGAKGFIPGEGTLIEGLKAMEVEIDNLIPYTEYDFYVQSICEVEESYWAGPHTFTTQGCPLAEKCEYEFRMSDEFGDGWSGSYIELYENGHYTAKVTFNSGISKIQMVPLCDHSEVSLKWVSKSLYDYECALEVVDPLGIPIYSFNFSEEPEDGATFFNFIVDCNPSCPRPSELIAVDETYTSAILKWKENGSAEHWEIEWGYYGTGFGYGVRVETNEPQYILEGLMQGTYYQFYARAICEENDSSVWEGPYVFSTECNPITFYPHTEKFNGAFFPPQCWKNVDADGDGYLWSKGKSTLAYEGIYYATSASWHSFAVGALTPDNYLITRKFAITNPNLALSFWIASLGDISFGVNLGMEHYSIMISTTNNEIESFETVFSETLTNNKWKQQTISLADYVGKDIYIAFRHHDCTDMMNLRLDLISIVSTQDIEEISATSSLNLYPNPTTDYLFVSELANIEIYNTFGQLEGKYSNTAKVDIQHLPAGVYVVKVFNENKNNITKIQVIR